MLLQELLIQITGLLENVNHQMESISEVIKNMDQNDPQLAKGWDTPDGWKGGEGWKAGKGWNIDPGKGWGT